MHHFLGSAPRARGADPEGGAFRGDPGQAGVGDRRRVLSAAGLLFRPAGPRCWGSDMLPVILTEHLVGQGFTPSEIESRRRRGEFSRLRPGAYALPTPEALLPAARHRQLIEATIPQLSADAAASYVSAAVLHDLPVRGEDLRTVHLTRPRTGGGGKRRNWVTLHAQPLEAADVTVVDGIQVTSLERTVFDLSRTLPYERAVAAGDRGLATGMSMEILTEMLERGRLWNGVSQARRTAAFIDGRAESPASPSVASAVRSSDCRHRSPSSRSDCRTARPHMQTSAGRTSGRSVNSTAE